MRWIFLTVIVLLFELFTYGAGRGLQWWAGSWLSISLLDLMIGLFWWVMHFGVLASHVWRALGSTVYDLAWLFVVCHHVDGGGGHYRILVLMKVAPHFLMPWVIKSTGRTFCCRSWLFGMILMGIYNAHTPTIRPISPFDFVINHLLSNRFGLGWFPLAFGSNDGDRQINRLTDMVKDTERYQLLIPGEIQMKPIWLFYPKF